MTLSGPSPWYLVFSFHSDLSFVDLILQLHCSSQKMNDFQNEVLRQVVAHCSHNIGWNAINASSLDLLTEVLQKYLTEIGCNMHIYSEQCQFSLKKFNFHL